MMDEIKAKETIYNDLRFRSRLEARWAVFFDSLGIKYQYEPYNFGFTDFEGDKYGYVPDFYLPCHRKYVEVKGYDGMLKTDWYKISGCIDYNATDISEKGLLILGDIPSYSSLGFGNIPYFPHLIWDSGITFASAAFFVYPSSKVVRNVDIIVGADNIFRKLFSPNFGIEGYTQFGEDMPEEITTECQYTNSSVRSYNFSSGLLKEAYKRAKFARFEHGETPAPKPLWCLKEGEK